jgi:hypothetical protein
VRKVSPPTGFDRRTVQPVSSRCTGGAIPALEAWVTFDKAMTFWEEEVLYLHVQMIKYVRGKTGGRDQLPICQGHKQTRILPNMSEQCSSLELSWGRVVGGFFAVFRVEIIFFSISIINGRLTGFFTFCVETAFYNGLLKEI